MATTGDLKKLRELDDFDVAAGDPDPRGWRVIAADGRPVGEVTDLLVDVDEMKARYLDVEVDRALGPAPGQRHLFVPTEAVAIGQRERDDRRIAIPTSAEGALRSAGDADAVLAGRAAQIWRHAGPTACNVRVARGGRTNG